MSERTFIDLFSGAGGLSLGLERAGWQPLLAVDSWPEAIATYRLNFAERAVIEADIQALDRQTITDAVPQRPDWVVGGPPCQGFSTVGKRIREDSRNQLVREFVRVVKTLRPSGFVLENVLGLKDMRFQGAIIDLFSPLGYDVAFHVLSAADYGVPQLRRRVIFVGHLELGFLRRPTPTHGSDEYVSVWDAISDLPVLGPGETAETYVEPAHNAYQEHLRRGSAEIQGHTVSRHPARLVEAISFIPDGGNRRAIPDELQPKSGFHNSYSRLSSREPAVAVTSNMGKPSATRCIHPFQDRGLTAREGARLQSFPDRFHFRGGIVSQRLQIANAVPPLLASALAQTINTASAWESERRPPVRGELSAAAA